MDFINLKSLNLTAEEFEDLIKLLAQMRGITTKELLSTIKLNLKHKNKKDLASKSQQKLIKSIKKQQKLTKQTKSQRELIKSQRKSGFDNNYLEYMSNGNNSSSFNENLELIKPYLYDLINVYQAKGEWKLQLSAEISFISQKSDSNEIPIMYTRRTPEEIIIGSETEEVAENLIMSKLQKYQDNLQK